MINTSSDARGDFQGASYVSALDEYTKRIESSIAEIDKIADQTFTTTFLFGVFVPVGTLVFQLTQKATDEGTIVRSYAQLVSVISLFVLGMMAVYFIYRRLIQSRRYRRNLATLLWPYEKLVQKLSQILEQGRLDEGTATLVELKLIEAEVAYGRAKRMLQRSSFFAIFGDSNYDIKALRDEFAERARRNWHNEM